ncbi:hypothetical protein COV20_06410 [Candidatus Woesearchaeota archaeon CG10_big_fil_rev_8_21_14_0_10_45_16]|nr:MAG: hypothetical protein COV20_06410 [Candidatus Woesearchaeota archaeon CG10_big_fil_rev_8_21_14_0_10_45_16]
MAEDGYEQIIQRYKQRVAEEFGEAERAEPKVTSREYSDFKKELYPARYTLYEKACNAAGSILKLNVDPKTSAKMIKDIEMCHLNVTPSGVMSLAILLPLAIIIFGSLISFAIFNLFFFVIFFMIAGMLLIPALQRVPNFMANTWKMKASNQMVQSIFYLVTYMRHTSNIERAIEFAADHLEPPLSLDFRKILWDVETQKFSTIRDSANAYLEKWQEDDKDFVESFHLVEASLFEPSEERRLALLDKALDVVLNGTYENMLHYAHNLKSPMTMLHMLGIILPILGLVILPLVVSFLPGAKGPLVTIIYISVLYNISLPVIVYYLGRTILAKRPAGYGAVDISEKSGVKRFANVNIPLGKTFVISVNPLYFSIMIFAVAFLIGISPLLLHAVNPTLEVPFSESIKLLDYVCPPEMTCPPTAAIGPFGLGSAILSIILIAGLGCSIGLFYSLRSKNVIKIRERTKALEDEFSSALFQLGNRLGDGLPAEIAFARVASTMQGTTSGDFFNVAERNITRLGMGLEQSLFDPRVGAVQSFPSKVIESSMKVLIESIKKGPRIAAQALLSMSRYIKEIHRVEERLKDLMGDVIGSMKAQIKFLTPAIAGIVIGITSMISTILTKLSGQLGELAGSTSQDVGGFGDLVNIFGIGMPTYYFQIVVGIYIIQIAYILTILSNGIENGSDKLGERYELGKNLIGSTLLYCFLAAVVMILFNLFAGVIVSNTGIG